MSWPMYVGALASLLQSTAYAGWFCGGNPGVPFYDCYYTDGTKRSFDDTKSICEGKGMHIPEFYDIKQYEFFKNTVMAQETFFTTSCTMFWLGYEKDPKNQSELIGRDGQGLRIEPQWDFGEPNNANGGSELCTNTRAADGWAWNDAGCINPRTCTLCQANGNDCEAAYYTAAEMEMKSEMDLDAMTCLCNHTWVRSNGAVECKEHVSWHCDETSSQCYFTDMVRRTQEEAKHFCMEKGMHLPAINSKAQYDSMIGKIDPLFSHEVNDEGVAGFWLDYEVRSSGETTTTHEGLLETVGSSVVDTSSDALTQAGQLLQWDNFMDGETNDIGETGNCLFAPMQWGWKWANAMCNGSDFLATTVCQQTDLKCVASFLDETRLISQEKHHMNTNSKLDCLCEGRMVLIDGTPVCQQAADSDSVIETANTVLKTVGCIWTISCAAFVILVFIFVRDFSFARKLHLLQEIFLLIAHVVILVMRNRTEQRLLCSVSASAISLFIQLFFAFMAVEAWHNMTMLGGMISSSEESWPSGRTLVILGVSLPLLSVAVHTSAWFDEQAGTYTWVFWFFRCWVNYDHHSVPAAMTAPIVLLFCAGTVLWDVRFNADRFPCTNKLKYLIAGTNAGYWPFVAGFGLATWVVGAGAAHSHSVASHTLLLALDICMGIFIAKGHIVGSKAAIVFVVKLWEKIRGKKKEKKENAGEK